MNLRTGTNFSFDFLLFISMLCLVIIGVFFIYSSNIASDGTLVSNEYIKQIIWIALGLPVMAVVFSLDYKKIENFSVYIYFFFIFLLLITLLFGNRVNGAKSWLGIMDVGIQPSEFAKISTIIMLSSFYAKRSRTIESFKTFYQGFLIVLLPVFFILAQPDMGTALVFIPIFLVISFISGTPIQYIFYIIAVGVSTALLIIISVWFQFLYTGNSVIVDFFIDTSFYTWMFIAVAAITVISLLGFFITKKRYYYWLAYCVSIITIALLGAIAAGKVLKPYQMMRLVVFLDPYIDPRGAGWNIIQSITAVGAGGIFGKGFLDGTQSHLRYLPQQSTDFIFSIISEETGFVGCIVVFTLFMIIIARGLFIGILSKDLLGTNIATGVVAMIFFHFTVNIGMAIGIMPITGIPLFFLSYGGSSIWTTMIGVALLLNIFFRRYKF